MEYKTEAEVLDYGRSVAIKTTTVWFDGSMPKRAVVENGNLAWVDTAEDDTRQTITLPIDVARSLRDALVKCLGGPMSDGEDIAVTLC